MGLLALALKTCWRGNRNTRPVFEPVLWFTKPYLTGETLPDTLIEHYNKTTFIQYEVNSNNLLTSGIATGESGLHPAQKPVRLLQSLFALTKPAGWVVLDPYCGSGSKVVSALYWV